jgi:autotransporter-associated beta strand protein
MKTPKYSNTSRLRRLSRINLPALAALVALPLLTAKAADINWQGGTADYTNAADWVGGVVPGAGDNAINDNGTNNVVQINVGDPDWTVNDIRAGNGAGDGAWVQNGQTVTLNGWFRLGIIATNTGVYTLNGGTINYQGNHFTIGEFGAGIVNMNGGAINGSGNFAINLGGINDGNVNPLNSNTCVFTQTNGAVNITGGGQLFVGNQGTGIYNLSGGSMDVHNYIAFGRSGGNGTVNMTGGILNQDGGGNLLVGTGYQNNGNTAVGVLNQSGGTINSQGQFLVPESSPATGTYNLSGTGALNVNDWIAIGRDGGTGVLNITNGSITHTGGGNFDIGAGGTGTVNQNGGAVTNLAGQTWIGDSSVGTWNLNGGIANLGTVNLSESGSGSGTLNVNGGSLIVTELTTGDPVAGSALYLNGGTIVAAADNANFLHDLTIAGISAGGAIFDSHGFNINIAQELDDNGGGGLTKDGLGTLTLSGPNTYVGNTVVNAGALAVTTASIGAGNYTVADNAALDVQVLSANAQLNVANLALGSSAGATVGFDLGGFGNPSSAPLNASGALAVNGTIVVNLTDTLPQIGQFPLIAFTGTPSISGGFTLGSVPFGVGAYLSNNVSSIDLVITNVSLPRWDGLAGGDWDIGLTTNWVNIGDGLPTYYAEGSKVLFDDNAAGTTMVNLTTALHPAGVTVNNSSLSYVFAGSGKISGATGLTKEGSSTLVITNSGGNDYTGATVISGGSLIVNSLDNGGSPSAIGASSADPTNLVLSGGTLVYSGPDTSINRGYSVSGTNQNSINTTGNLTLTGTMTADAAAGFSKSGLAGLVYATAGSNVLSDASSGGYDVLDGSVIFDGSNGGQVNVIGNVLGLNGQNSVATVLVTNSVIDTPNIGLNNNGGTTNVMTIDGNSTVSLSSWLIFNNGGAGVSTLTLNNGTLNVNNGKILMGGAPAPGGVSTSILNINGGVLNNAGGNAFDIGDGNWNGAGARTGIVNQSSGTNNCNNDLLVGYTSGGTGFYNLTNGQLNVSGQTEVGNGGVGTFNLLNGTVTSTGEMDVGNNGGVGTLNISNGTLNVNNWFVTGRAGSTNCFLNMSGGTLNKNNNGAFIIASGAGNNGITNSGTFNISGGTVNSSGEFWIAENTLTTGTNNISGTASMNIHDWVTVGRGGLGVVNMSGGQFNSDTQPFVVGIYGGGTGVWNQVGGALSVNQDIWISEGENNSTPSGTINLNGGTITNTGWLAVGREGGDAVFNINGGTYVRSGAGGGANGPNVTIATGGTANTGTVNVNGGYVDVSAGDTWIGENFVANWNQNNGSAINSYVQLGRNGGAAGTLSLNGGMFAATQIAAGGGSSTMNFNGGILLARASSTSFISGLGQANVLAGGAIIDTAANSVSVNQALLGGSSDGGLIKNGTGTLYLNGVNTYTNITQVTAGALGGSGTIMGQVTVASGARLSPGTASIGTLTINNALSLDASSSTLVKVSMDGGATNDAVNGLSSVSYGGSLVVTNAGTSPLVYGSQFKLFSSASPGSGNFTSVTILPAGTGTFNPATGILTITSVGVVTFNPVTASSGNLILTGQGGTPGAGYTLLTTTNLVTPVSLWTTSTTGTFDGTGAFSNAIPINVSQPTEFFRMRTP